MDKYRGIWKIGNGSYGEVYKYFDTSSREIVAIKKITIDDEFDGVPSMIIREVSILKEMEHENIVRLLDVVNEKDSVYLVFEHLDMDLLKYIKRTQLAMKSHTIKNFLRQILSGVAYCHAHKVLHRDLKPPNLLVDLKLKRVKLADFGLARTVGIPSKSYSNEVVTLCYRAPELLLGSHQYSSAIDMWSVGCIFGEMVTLNPIFPARSELDQLLSIFSILGTPDEETWPGVTSLSPEITLLPKMEPKDLAKEFQGLEPAGVDILSKMLCLDPIKRITARDALKHEYLT
ncbi:cell division control protein 2 homolog isoform X3 [Diospyros lotus]|uniref:cell division control protein 2 homolog isoform X3 n=1 Tax=Diospyros lotus TaxID=55363 RepID=UPI002259BB09|nr:cell division control protein 2 homolog isoform X3 [Diospyros lotus]XP_052205577.1 cell division control protein 2 homolog isoform X3 [Diospyros lotus]